LARIVFESDDLLFMKLGKEQETAEIFSILMQKILKNG